jgi:predicted nucleic acid-binding protein
MALFDTDVLIDHLLGKTGATETILKFKNSENYCSVITIGEILFGMRPDEKEKTLKLINSLTALNVNKKITFIAYEIKHFYKGFNLELYDCIIAATALENNFILVTRNSKHYPDKRIKLFVPEY